MIAGYALMVACGRGRRFSIPLILGEIFIEGNRISNGCGMDSSIQHKHLLEVRYIYTHLKMQLLDQRWKQSSFMD